MTKEGVTLKADNGKEYKFSPFELKHFAQFEAWATRVPFERLKEKIKLLKEADATDEQITRIIDAAESNSNSAYARGQLMDSIEGIRQMLTISLKIEHKDITEEELDSLVSAHGLKNLRVIVDEMSRLSEQDEKN